jgi:hypothetical protein
MIAFQAKPSRRAAGSRMPAADRENANFPNHSELF